MTKQTTWEERFEEFIKNYPNNLEITGGELVDGSVKPLKQFISQELALKEQEVIEEEKAQYFLALTIALDKQKDAKILGGQLIHDFEQGMKQLTTAKGEQQ